MRPEIKEYNIDWMIWSIIKTAGRTTRGSDKEFSSMLEYVPYFKGILEPIVREGEAGKQFLELVGEYMGNIVNAHDDGKKLAMTTFCFSPAILYAMDIMPVTLEAISTLGALMWRRGTYDYLDYCCEVGFTETSCSSQRGSLGAYLAGLGENIDMIVCDSAGVCDTNANAFAFTSAYLDKPFYQLNYPPELVTDRTTSYHREDYYGLIEFLEEQTGNKIDEDRLRDVLTELQKQDEILTDIEEMQSLVPNPMPILYNLFIYAGRFFFAGMGNYTRMLETMRDTVSANAAEKKSGLRSGKENLRSLFCYIDHFAVNLSLWDWLDEHGITQVGNILSKYYNADAPYLEGNREAGYTINTENLDSMIDTMAQMNARMPMVLSIRGPYDAPYMWFENSLMLAKVFSADCVVYNGTPGCRNTWGMIKPFARDMEKEGLPTYIMYGDAFDERVESWDATAERLEEFFRVRGLL